MSVELTVNISPETAVEQEWEPPMPPTDLIFDDGEPLESNRHRRSHECPHPVIAASLERAL
ncbi:MAG: hypothetical protein Fur0025_39890 [Oscillatoriaceae cyanobacterium]